MDAHTPTTSPTGNLHGMPVAHLLGYGDPRLTEIFGLCPKIRPQNLALVGIRSFEAEERELLEKLKVPIFYDEDIQKRGLKAVMNDALTVVNDGTDCFGMSIDVDAFQIQDAPGTGTPENGGIVAAEFLNYLKTINYQRHIATEIVEFMPEKDDEVKTTEKLVVNLLEAIYLTKFGERK
uniref:Arginase n=1 Tax=Panagrolaimus sp. JU765 TaxID=591449 RepID=A0AC34QY92_9BILA